MSETSPEFEPLGPPPEDLETRRQRDAAGRALFADDAPDLMKIGRFALEGQLGTGGQGVVYLARDPKLERTVALKRLAVTSPRHIERMRTEALALAQVSHDNVVKIFELDEDETGRPFLVMELVEGQPLHEWLAATPHPWTTVVDLLITVGDGLAAVHAAGLVHRDVKPHNIVITGGGQAKLVDFGIAALHDDGEPVATSPSSPVIGTRSYMAPEQRLGRAGPKSDQFAFCVVAYEALYGQRPSRSDAPRNDATPGTAPPAGATTAEESGARRAADGIRRAPRQLERVIARGLEANPKLRHADMQTLVAALRRLRHRRSPWPVTVFAVAGILGAASLMIPSSSPDACDEPDAARQLWQGEDRERVRAAFERSGSAEATQAFTAVDGMIEAAAGALDERLGVACETKPAGIDRERMLGRIGEQQGLLRALIGALREMETETTREIPERLAGALAPLHAGPEDACELRRPATGSDAELEALRDLGRRATTLGVAGRYDDALALGEEVVARATGDAWASTRATLHLSVGRLALESRRLELARDELEAARSLAETHDCDGLGAEALALWAKAQLLDARPDVDAADHATRQALEKLDSLGDTDGPRRAHALNSRGLVLQRQRRYPEAIASYEQSLAILERLDPPAPLEQSDGLLNLGITQAQAGQPQLAIETIERGRRLREEALWPEHPSLYRFHASLSFRWLALGDLDAAEREQTRALALAEGLGDRNPRLAQLHIGMARLLDWRSEFERALQHAEQADAILKAEHGENAIERLGALEAIGQVCMDAGWAHRALPSLELALSLQGSADTSALDLAIGRGKLAEARARAGQPDIALRLYDEAWRTFADDPSLRGDSFYPELQLRRGEALMAAGRRAEAVDALRAAVAWWVEHHDNQERLAIARWSLAQAQCPSDSGREAARAALEYYEHVDSDDAVETRADIEAWLVKGCPPTD